MTENKYIISPISCYDEYHEMWFTAIAEDKKDKPYFIICAGKTKKKSRDLAKRMIKLLDESQVLD